MFHREFLHADKYFESAVPNSLENESRDEVGALFQ